MKKRFIFLLAVLLLLSACAPATPEETAVPPSTETTAAPVETTAAPVETTQVPTQPPVLKNVDRYPLETDAVLTAVTGWEHVNLSYGIYAENWHLFETITGIDVQWQYVDKTQIHALCDAEALPDLFFQTSGLSLTDIQKMGAAGKLVDFSEHLEQMPNLTARLEEHPLLFSTVADPEGHVYTLPQIQQTPDRMQSCVYIRTDLTERIGWKELPTTIESFLHMCKDLQAAYGGQEGFYAVTGGSSIAFTYNGIFSDFFFPAFGELMLAEIIPNPEGTQVVAGFSTEQYKQYLRFLQELYKAGCLDTESFNGDANAGRRRLVYDLAAIGTSGTILEQAIYDLPGADFRHLPAMGSEQFGTQPRWAKPNIYMAGSYMVSADCGDLEAALAFLDALYADETDPLNEEGTVWGVSIWLGEIGRNITVDEVKGTYEIHGDPKYDMSTWSSNWLRVWGSGSGPYLKWGYSDAHQPSMRKKMEAYREYLKPVSVDVLYSNMLPLTIQEQLLRDELLPGIESYVNEMSRAFVNGQADLDTQWEEYLAKLDQLGLGQLLEVYQAALERSQKEGLPLDP